MIAPRFYSVYGLLLSSDQPLSGLPEAPGVRTPDICLQFGHDSCNPSQYEHVFELSHETAPQIDKASFEPLLTRVASSCVGYRIRYSTGLECLLKGDGSCIEIAHHDTVSAADLAGYISGPILGFAMRLMGILCLHASVLEVDGHAIAFIAPSGGGKSTTAAALASIGHSVISDDVLVPAIRDDRVVAEPGLPWLRLCEDASEALFSEHSGAPVMKRFDDKQLLQLPQQGYDLVSRALPLVAIYTGISNQAELSIAPVSGAQALMALLGNTYPSRYYRLQQQHRKADLRSASRLLQQVSVRGLHYEKKLERVGELCRLLVRDAREQVAQSSLRVSDSDLRCAG